MATLRQFFARLRWKFMLAYALITAIAIFLALFVALGVNVRHTVYIGDSAGWFGFQEEMQTLALQMDDLLQACALDAEEFEARMAGVLLEFVESEDIATYIGTIPLNAGNIGLIAFFDPEGRVHGTYPDGVFEMGGSLRANLPAEGDIVVNAVLYNGEAQSSRRQPSTHHNYIAHQIVLADGGIGGVLLRYDPNVGDVWDTMRPMLAMPAMPWLLFCLLTSIPFGLVASTWFTRRLGRITTAADAWRRADFAARIRDDSLDELGRLADNLNVMAGQLENHLQTRSELAAIEERNRVGRDLHDVVKQQVFAATLQVSAAKEILAGPGPTDSVVHKAGEATDKAEQLLQTVGRELTRLIREMRPAELEGKGLPGALRELCDDWSRETGIACEVRTQCERTLSLRRAQEMFRVAQEALNNVARHSHATLVELHLVWSADRLTLTVTDDGRGMPDRERRGFGLRNMRDRMETLGGSLKLENPVRGTRIVAVCPLDKTDGEQTAANERT